MQRRQFLKAASIASAATVVPAFPAMKMYSKHHWDYLLAREQENFFNTGRQYAEVFFGKPIVKITTEGNITGGVSHYYFEPDGRSYVYSCSRGYIEKTLQYKIEHGTAPGITWA